MNMRNPLFQKNNKLMFYTKNLMRFLLPLDISKKRLQDILSFEDDDDYIQDRVNYYNKLSLPFSLSGNAVSIRDFKWTKMKKNSSYFFDLLEYLRYFDRTLAFDYQFGDKRLVPETPSLIKSRPIEGDNANSVLMNLDKVRHFQYVNDTIPFEKKKNILFWRGQVYQPHRKYFMEKCFHLPMCDVGQINTQKCDHPEWIKGKITIPEHLKYKFILTIEGNDVASNLKWVMSSNSLAMMTKPKYETWFMEGKLIPNYHYVLLKDDYSDLEEKMEFYSAHVDEAVEITRNANEYVRQFRHQQREDKISVLVLQKYFQLARQ